MSFTLPEDANPFEAPRAGIGGSVPEFAGGATDAELIRRAHIAHEASIRSIGILFYLNAFFGVGVTIFVALLAGGVVPTDPQAGAGLPPGMLTGLLWGATVLCLLLTVLYYALGYGMRRLQTWARWTMVVLLAIFLLYVAFVGVVSAIMNPIAGVVTLVLGGLIPGYIFSLLVGPKGGVVFSPEYKAIILQTPHVKYKTSIIVKVFLGLLLLVIVLIVVAAIFNAMNR